MVNANNNKEKVMFQPTESQSIELFNLMVNMGRKKVQQADAEDVASDSLLKAMSSFDPSYGDGSVSFEKFTIGVVFRRTLLDKIRFIYRRKNTKSIDFVYHDGNSDEFVDHKEDKVQKIVSHVNELFEIGSIDDTEYKILIGKAHRMKGKEIAKEVGLTEGRITQIWDRLQEVI
jgi:DNA-directed RNA polymerase specialized sigma24 family protein